MKLVDDESNYPLSAGNIKEDIQFWVSEFLKQKELEGVASKTIRSYKFALKSFEQFVLKYSKDNSMENIGAKFVNRFLIEYQEQIARVKLKNKKIDEKIYQKISKQTHSKNLGKNDAGFFIADEFKNTLLHRLITVKMLLKFISENNKEGHDYQSVFHHFVKIKLKENNTKYLTVDEIDAVIDKMIVWHKEYKKYMSHRKRYRLRDANRDALLILLYALTGARSAEVVKIKLKDISDFSSRGRNYYKIKIREAKGGKPREVVVEKDFIETYMEFFKKELPDQDFYLSSKYYKGHYVNENYHEDSIRRFGNFVIKDVLNFGLKSGLHLFRRGYATKRILNDKEHLAVVSAELGNSINILEKYYFKFDAQIAIENK